MKVGMERERGGEGIEGGGGGGGGGGERWMERRGEGKKGERARWRGRREIDEEKRGGEDGWKGGGEGEDRGGESG